jgi:hypothetical protein
MGEAYDRHGHLLDTRAGDSFREVFDQLHQRNPDAHELRIRHAEEAHMPASPHSPLKEKIDDLFTYHPPTPEQIPQYEAIRAAAKVFAHIALDNSPVSADQTAAIRLLRECVMTLNASIANKGLS